MEDNGARGARVWVAGFVGTTILAVCCSLPMVLRRSIHDERVASRLILQIDGNFMSQAQQVYEQQESFRLWPHPRPYIQSESALLCIGTEQRCHAEIGQRVNATDFFCQLQSGGFRRGRCTSYEEGASMKVSSLMPHWGLSCLCSNMGGSEGFTMLQSTPQAVDAFQGDTTKRFEFARGVAIVCTASASFCLLLRICGMLRRVRSIAVGGGISSWWREFTQTCTWWKVASKQKVDWRSKHIRDLAMKKRLRRASDFLWIFYLLSCIQLLLECRIFWEYGFSELFLYTTSAVPSMCVLMFGMLHQLKIQEVSPMWLDGLNAMLSAVWVWRCLVLGYWVGGRNHLKNEVMWVRYKHGWSSDSGYRDFTAWMGYGRLLQGLICGNANLSTLLNVIMTVADMHAYCVADPAACGYGFSYNSPQLGACVFGSMIFYWNAQQLLAEATALTDAETSNSKYSLAHRVLEATCDAVAYLDVDLSLLAPCPKLAQILLRHHSAAHEGSCFVDFVFQDEDDVDRVQNLMQAEVKASSSNPTNLDPARTVHVHMVDAYHNKVSVQLYWCCTVQVDGQVRHLVGISQHAETEKEDAETSQGQRGANTHLGTVQEDMRASFPNRIERDCSSVSLASSQVSASSAESADEVVQIADQEISVCIDAANRALTFLSCSNGFLLLCGSLGPGSGLGAWLHGKTDAFASWLSSSSNQDSLKVCLQPPGIVGEVYRARCHRRAAQPGLHAAAVEDASIVAVELMFDDVRLRKAGSGRKSRRRRESDTSRISAASSVHGSCFATVDVGLPAGSFLAVEFALGTDSSQGEFLSCFQVGRSMQECLVDRASFIRRLVASTKKIPHAKQHENLALDLGRWNLCTRGSASLWVQFILTGLKASSNEAEPDSVVYQLNVIHSVAPAGVTMSSRKARGGLWLTLGLDVEEASSGYIVIVVTARSIEMNALLGFDPLGHSFLPWLHDPGKFLQWSELLNDLEPNHNSPNAAVEYGELILRPRQLLELGWGIKAVCRCVILPKEQTSDNDLFTVDLGAAQRIRLRQSL